MADAGARAAILRATLHAQRAIEALDAETAQALIDLYTQAADDIAARLMLHAGADGTLALAEMRSALTQIQARLAELARARDGLLGEALDQAATLGAEAIAGGVATAASMRISHEALRFIQTFIAEDGLQLSDRVWRLDRQARDRVVNAIEQAVIQGWGAEQAARELLGQGKPVPAELRDKARSADAAALGRQVDELMTGPGSPMDNAMRVMRTEINRAHGEAYMMGGEDHPDFAGWRFLLSPAHPKPDICDLLSMQNLYGLGGGVYPDRERLPWPAHPNTLSFVVIVFQDEITAADRAGAETPMEALARLSPEQRLGVLGKGKTEVYEAGKLTQGMIQAPLRDVRERIGPMDWRDDLTKRYFSGNGIQVAGFAQPFLLTGNGSIIDKAVIPLLVGAPDNSRIHVKGGRSGIHIEVRNELFTKPARYRLDATGILHGIDLYIDQEAPAGIATRMTALQVETAAAVGVREIQLFAARSATEVGYMVWPRLGFDAPLTPAEIARAAEQTGIQGVKTVLDLIRTAAGREWWANAGTAREMRLDLTGDSRGRIVLRNYLLQKGVRL